MAADQTATNRSREDVLWYQLSGPQAARQLDVDPEQGLSSTEAARRLEQYGPNTLSEKDKEPLWRAFIRQYKDYMRIVLLVAGISSILIGQFSTGIVLLAITVVNAFTGLRQEKRAEDSIAALRQMMKITATVRRDGQPIEIPVDQVVPGDIALVEAGDALPADGRLLVAATLEVEESALTGESTPVLKDTAPVVGDEVALGDRIDMAYMHSAVTRGRGELVVTATGMDTEVGHIAGMLQAAKEEKSPLTKQIDSLTILIAAMAGIALVIIILIGYFGWDAPFKELYLLGIALAIAAIPTAMPVVITTTLSIGTKTLAAQNAIVKKLPAVETLGSTSAICSDKTGTLTLNKMTAHALVVSGQTYEVTGQGYENNGEIETGDGAAVSGLDDVLLPMILCSDAVIDDGDLVGDPTEGALVVLAEKGGLGIQQTRQQYPRIAEVPFDSEYKLMATYHNMTGKNGQPVVRAYVKGAPDVLLERSSYTRGTGEDAVQIDGDRHEALVTANADLAKRGMRVLVVAERDFEPDTFDPNGDLLDGVKDLTLLGMAGIVDPARPEAKAAIADCKDAGIRVRMITGDHPVTAATIATELGIKGRALTGAEFRKLSDQEASDQIDDIGVIARVAPEDKVHLVQVLQGQNKVVAMTGDGVNDAPALKTANIGVAMGITGTDVSKEAAVMILTDDNFATIVGAVRYGRTIYDNLLKYIRFQMAGLFSFILAFLGAALTGVALTLFLPFQILFVNYFIQGVIGAATAFDTETPGLMKRPPRPADQPIMTKALVVRLLIVGLVTASLAIGAYAWADSETGSTTSAQSLAMVIFALMSIPISLNLRHPLDTVFSKETFSNRYLLLAYGWVVLALILVTELGFLKDVFDTTSLTGEQWGVCVVAAVAFLLAGEIGKFILRRIRRQPESAHDEWS